MQHDTTSSSSSINTGEKESPSSSHIRSAVSDIINQQPYSTIFFHSGGSLATSPAKTGSIPVSAGGNNTNTTIDTATAAADGLSKLMSDHRTLLNQHALCLLNLQKTFKEAETLRQENTNLRMASHDLTNQLNLLIQADLHQTPSFRDNWCGQTLPLSERLDGLSMNEKRRESGEDFSSESPTSVIENDRADVHDVEAGRVTLPKSISVRSNEFLKMSHGAHSGPSASNPSLDGGVSRTRTRTPSPVSGPQKVYVRGGSRKDGPIEMEVYNQGMYKTELCNKWQETGTCPYNDHCQFAHGIGELRPVIRHPRYKTEVCRMVLAGDPCPYGHRCHFRHALTEQEKLMVPLRMD